MTSEVSSQRSPTPSPPPQDLGSTALVVASSPQPVKVITSSEKNPLFQRVNQVITDLLFSRPMKMVGRWFALTLPAVVAINYYVSQCEESTCTATEMGIIALKIALWVASPYAAREYVKNVVYLTS